MGLRDHIPGVPKKNIGTTGRMSEKRVAKSLNGRLTPASGALSGAKGDIHLTDYLVEAKATEKDSMSVKLAWLTKIAAEARSEGKEPALSISFVTGDGRPVFDGEWVAVPKSVFEEMTRGVLDQD